MLALALAGLALVAGACTDDGEGTDVQGLQVTRSPSESAAASDPVVVEPPAPSDTPAPAATETSEPAPDPEPSETPAAEPTDSATTEPAPPEPTAGPTSPPPATATPTATPTPSSTPTPAPPSSTLRSGRGWSFTTWTPERTDDGWRWTETSSAPTITPDDPDGTRAYPLRTDLHDVRRPDGEAPRRRNATCSTWIQAPHDEGVEARGTITVQLLAGRETVSSGAFEADTIVPPGGRLELPDLPAAMVDAADERDVTCSVRFERG